MNQIVSRDREFESPNDATASRSTNIRFRTQSPSTTNRRSRERERGDREQNKEFNSTMNHHSVDMGVEVENFEDARMTEEILGYPTQNSEDVEVEGSGDPNKQQTPSSRGHNRTNSLQAIDRLVTKIAYTKESIRREQTARDGSYNFFYSQVSCVTFKIFICYQHFRKCQ